MAPPETIEFEGKTIALWTYDALERLSKANLKQRALNLRDQIGEARLMPLRTSAQPASLIRWQLVAQCSLCEAVGLDFSLKDFGAPTEIGEAEEQNVYFGAHDKGSRPPTRSAPEPLSAPFATMPPPPPAAPAAPRMEYEYSAPHAAQDSMPSTPTDAMRDKSYSDGALPLAPLCVEVTPRHHRASEHAMLSCRVGTPSRPRPSAPSPPAG